MLKISLHALAVSITALVLTSCANKKAVEGSNERDSLVLSQARPLLVGRIPENIGVDLSQSRSLVTSKLVSDDHEIIKLETADNYLIGEISKVIVHGNRIFILDRGVAKTVFCFDRTGKFINLIGSRGGGPGEIDDPRDIEVVDNRVYLIDRQCRIFTFDLDGRFLSYFRLPFLSTQFCLLNGQSIFLYNQEKSDQFTDHLIQIKQFQSVVSSDFTIRSEFVSDYSGLQSFARNKNKALFIKMFCDTIFRLDSISVYPAFVISSSKQIPSDYFSSRAKVQDAFSSNDYFRLAPQNFAENDASLIFTSTYQGSLNYHYFDKQSRKHVWFKRFSDDLFQGGLFPPVVVGIDDEHFVYVLSMPEMLSNYRSIRSENPEELDVLIQKYPKLKDFFLLCEKSAPDDNPALLVTRVSSKIYE